MTEGDIDKNQREIDHVLSLLNTEREMLNVLRWRIKNTEEAITTSNIRIQDLKKALHRLNYRGK